MVVKIGVSEFMVVMQVEGMCSVDQVNSVKGRVVLKMLIIRQGSQLWCYCSGILCMWVKVSSDSVVSEVWLKVVSMGLKIGVVMCMSMKLVFQMVVSSNSLVMLEEDMGVGGRYGQWEVDCMVIFMSCFGIVGSFVLGYLIVV